MSYLHGITESDYREAEIEIRRGELEVARRQQYWEAARAVALIAVPAAAFFGIVKIGDVLDRVGLVRTTTR